jgi:protein gp37
MTQATSIEWTDLSWNPVHGCSKVSPGCAHCYAETLSRQRGQTPKPWTPENAPENVILKPHKLREPLSKAKVWQGLGAAAAAAGKTEGKLVFVNSMSDLFHEDIPDEYIAQVFGIMALAPQHTFQILTKRPERMRDLMIAWKDWRHGLHAETSTMPLSNVWLGVSIENRRWTDRARLLQSTPAAVRFVSAEPLLGPLICPRCKGQGSVPAWGGAPGMAACPEGCADNDSPYDRYWLEGIDWLIVGGESGSEHRPMQVEWVQDLLEACVCVDCHGEGEREEGIGRDCFGNWDTRTVRCGTCREGMTTAFFFKQDSGARPGQAGRFAEMSLPKEFPR